MAVFNDWHQSGLSCLGPIASHFAPAQFLDEREDMLPETPTHGGTRRLFCLLPVDHLLFVNSQLFSRAPSVPRLASCIPIGPQPRFAECPQCSALTLSYHPRRFCFASPQLNDCPPHRSRISSRNLSRRLCLCNESRFLSPLPPARDCIISRPLDLCTMMGYSTRVVLR